MMKGSCISKDCATVVARSSNDAYERMRREAEMMCQRQRSVGWLDTTPAWRGFGKLVTK